MRLIPSATIDFPPHLYSIKSIFIENFGFGIADLLYRFALSFK